MLEFILGDFEANRWKAAGSSRTRGTSGDNVVGDAVFNRSLFGDWSRNIRVFAKDVSKRGGRYGSIDRTYGWCRRGNTGYSKVGFSVNQATVSEVNEEVEMTKEICANVRVVNIGNGKNPRKGTAETKVKG